MPAVTKPKLEVGSIIPFFELMSVEGRTVSIWDLRAKKNMVLVFLPAEDCPSCDDFLRSTALSYHRYETERADVLAIVRGTFEQAMSLRDRIRPPYPVLYDVTGAVTSRYTDELPAVFVADKFGELYAEWIVGRGGFFPAQKEILDIVELINLECPE